VLPQLLLLRQTAVPTVLDSYYLLALGAYRAFYLLNWAARAADPKDLGGRGLRVPPTHAIAVVFGVVQTALYADFAWVYWTRQRVKLRRGGVVVLDADDFRRSSWLLRALFALFSLSFLRRQRGPAGLDEDDDAEGGGGGGGGGRGGAGGGRWGARGVSVSADDYDADIHDDEEGRDAGADNAGGRDGSGSGGGGGGGSKKKKMMNSKAVGAVKGGRRAGKDALLQRDGSRPEEAVGMLKNPDLFDDDDDDDDDYNDDGGDGDGQQGKGKGGGNTAAAGGAALLGSQAAQAAAAAVAAKTAHGTTPAGSAPTPASSSSSPPAVLGANDMSATDEWRR
jgi:hypothetical protein